MMKKFLALLAALSLTAPASALPGKKCAELTDKNIARLDDSSLEEAVFACALEKIGKNYQDSYRIITAQPRMFQVVFITMELEAEVNNGGFHQYFWNSSGEFADLAPAAFLEIGAQKNANLVERAIKIAISEVPKMRKYQAAGTLQAFSDSYKETALGPLDDEFYKLKENLTALRSAYVRKQIASAHR